MSFFYARLFTPQQIEGLLAEDDFDRHTAYLTPGRGLQTYDEFLLLRVLLRDYLEAAAHAAAQAAEEFSHRIAVLHAVVRTLLLMAALQRTQHRMDRVTRYAHWRELWQCQTGKRIPAYLRGC